MSQFPLSNIRNFSIIAHIDHGKSTLSDRLIHVCGGLSDREMQAQVLDSMDIERERGITIKSQSVTLSYHAKNGQNYQLNFIDTPGHVDFSYEVSRSLSACEGAILVVDASQGVEAQSVANCYKALDLGLEVVPVLNKIDLPQADVERVKGEIEDVIGIDASEGIPVSAKKGIGIDDALEAIVHKIPAPSGNEDAPLKALIIDSWFDAYLGVVVLVRIIDGVLRSQQNIKIHSTGRTHKILDIGVFTPKRESTGVLGVGQVGWIVCGIKEVRGAPVGDTLISEKDETTNALPGFQEVKPMVYAGLYPVQADDYKAFREALEKLALNDASLSYEPENADTLGQGFRCGFLGLLHMEITQERLEREYGISLITTTPTVGYEVLTKKGHTVPVSKPSDLPDPNHIESILEPMANVNLLLPEEYVGKIMELCTAARGTQKNFAYVGRQISLSYEIPLAEVVVDFFDDVKSISRGYASLEFQYARMQISSLVRLDILINGDVVDALSMIVHQNEARSRGILVLDKLKESIPRQMYEIALQAAIGGKILARANVKAFRKNVIAKCYGGDATRKRKLLEKQKAGKKRMKKIGNVEVPQEAFLAILSRKK